MRVKVVCTYARDHKLWSAITTDRAPGSSTTGPSLHLVVDGIRHMLEVSYPDELEIVWVLAVDTDDIAEMEPEEQLAVQQSLWEHESVFLTREVYFAVPRLDGELAVMQQRLTRLERDLKLREQAFDALNEKHTRLVDAIAESLETWR